MAAHPRPLVVPAQPVGWVAAWVAPVDRLEWVALVDLPAWVVPADRLEWADRAGLPQWADRADLPLTWRLVAREGLLVAPRPGLLPVTWVALSSATAGPGNPARVAA